MIAKEQKRDIKNKQLGSRNKFVGAFFVMSPIQGRYITRTGYTQGQPLC